jgi:hypothetical protein
MQKLRAEPNRQGMLNPEPTTGGRKNLRPCSKRIKLKPKPAEEPCHPVERSRGQRKKQSSIQKE